MTDYKKYINALRKCAKEHENEVTPFAHIIVSDLCRDTANLLESLEQNSYDDYINRKEAIEVLKNNYRMKALDEIQRLPSVQLKPKTGHWIDREEYDADRWKCSECGRTEQYQENFCPNCGAKMERRWSEDGK